MKDIYQKVKDYYDCGLWDKTRLGNMVIRDIITEEEYIAIVGYGIEGGGVRDDLMIGATATEDGAAGLVPPPPKGKIKRYLGSDGIWGSADGGDAATVGGKTADDLLDYRNATNTPTIPTSLPANGGNADTLGDSVSARYILNNSANYQKIFSLAANRYQDYPTTINIKTGRGVSGWFDFRTYSGTPSRLYYLSRIALDALNKGTISLYTSFAGGQTWDFYIRSSEAYGGVNVAVLGTQAGVVFKNEGVSSLPEGYVAAT